jgi:pimeloyl-ACP methyl ester carboxylesterase
LQTRNVYLISGLGADHRLFNRIELPKVYNLIHIEWIPAAKNESIPNYAVRLSQQIDSSYPFYLIGLSFGGMIASELAKVLNPLKTIIISSASTALEIPWYYKIAGFLKLPVIIPISLLKSTNSFTYWIFGARTKQERALLKQVLKDTDSKFLKWAMNAITSWKNKERPKKLYHIHGTADKILPITLIKPDFRIENGEHLMVYSESKLISKVLLEKMGGH